MAKKFGKFLLFSAVVGAAAYGIYQMSKDENQAAPAQDGSDDIFDDEIPEEDLDEEPVGAKTRSYSSLTFERAEEFAKEAYAKAKTVVNEKAVPFAKEVGSKVEPYAKEVKEKVEPYAKEIKEKVEPYAKEAKEKVLDARDFVMEKVDSARNKVVDGTATEVSDEEPIVSDETAAPVQENSAGDVNEVPAKETVVDSVSEAPVESHDGFRDLKDTVEHLSNPTPATEQKAEPVINRFEDMKKTFESNTVNSAETPSESVTEVLFEDEV